MPLAPLHACAHPGCGKVVRGVSRCEQHQKQEQREVNSRRGTANERGYGARWRRARTLFLKEHPVCVECEKVGRLRAATVVDHKKPHRGDYGLFWDESNWQPLCKPCHDRKTAMEDGRWGPK